MSGRRLVEGAGSCLRKPLTSVVTCEREVAGQGEPVTSLWKKLIPASR